jgi:hypothetical protein
MFHFSPQPLPNVSKWSLSFEMFHFSPSTFKFVSKKLAAVNCWMEKDSHERAIRFAGMRRDIFDTNLKV